MTGPEIKVGGLWKTRPEAFSQHEVKVLAIRGTARRRVCFYETVRGFTLRVAETYFRQMYEPVDVRAGRYVMIQIAAGQTWVARSTHPQFPKTVRVVNVGGPTARITYREGPLGYPFKIPYNDFVNLFEPKGDAS